MCLWHVKETWQKQACTLVPFQVLIVSYDEIQYKVSKFSEFKL
jgi:hypothetical protein